MDVTELIRQARARTYGMIKPNVIDELADALERSHRIAEYRGALLNLNVERTEDSVGKLDAIRAYAEGYDDHVRVELLEILDS